MVVVRMTLSNAVEEVASLRWISWRSFSGLSSHQGATCRSSVRGCLPPCSAETRRPSASAKNLPMRRMLMNVSFSSRRWTSWGHSWWLIAAHTQKQTHWGFLAGGRTIYRRVEQTRNCGEFSEILGVDFGGWIFQGSNWCFWAKNLKNISKELSEEYTCQRGAPEGINRGQAGRPRVFFPLLDFNFLWWLPGAIICFCPVHLACFAPSKSHESLLLCLWCPLATLFLHFVSFTLSHA